jgi:D-lactate dehydrogenase
MPDREADGRPTMKIAFFEIESWERRYLRKQLQAHELRFYLEPVSLDNAEGVSDIQILSTFIDSRVDRPLLGHLPELKMVATRSTGFDHIDLNECKRRSIVVSNVPSYGENTVAEHTFGLILSLSRNLCNACVKRLTGDFSLRGLTGFDLKGKTLGVVGTGRIGLHVIKIAKGFGMNVLAYDAKQNELLAEVLGFAYVSLEELLSQSHIVTLHIPYNEHTHHLINRERIRLMKKGAFLINTARGTIVDTEALVEALDSKNIGGAGLDVLEGEELVKEEKAILGDSNKLQVLSGLGINHILLSKPNVIYTPHIAFYSKEALQRILETTAQNIADFASGNPRNVVDVNQ